MTSEEQLRELFDQKLTGISAEIKSSNELVLIQLAQIKDLAEKTNGRVNALEDNRVKKVDCERANNQIEENLETVEKETITIRWFERRPVRFVLIVIAFFVVQIPEVREVLFGWLQNF